MFKLTKIFILSLVLVFGFALIALAQEIDLDESIQGEADDSAKDIIISLDEITADEEVALDEDVTASDLEASEPKLLPDSPFYFLKNWQRGIRSFFTFNQVKKVNLRARYASEKLLEARKLVEKTDIPEVIEKAVENYENEINKVKEIAEKIEEKASQNIEVGKFLDKFIKHQVLHQKILEKLEEQVPEQAFEKIEEARENHLQRFGEVMQKLEEKTEIAQRLENNLEKVKGSEFKGFKNLEILKNLEEKVPEQAKEAIREARENTLIKLKEELEEMPVETQEKFKDYIEKIGVKAETKMEILEDIKSELKEEVGIKEELKELREEIMEKIPIQIKREECPQFMPPAPGFCKQGRIVIKRDAKGCLMPPKCIIPGEKQIKEKGAVTCIVLWDPVCGNDGKTYSNKCWIEASGVEIAHQGACKTLERKCAVYTRNNKQETHCAACGDGICESFEFCTPSVCSEEIISEGAGPSKVSCTNDCGLLYCPKDCEKE